MLCCVNTPDIPVRATVADNIFRRPFCRMCSALPGLTNRHRCPKCGVHHYAWCESSVQPEEEDSACKDRPCIKVSKRPAAGEEAQEEQQGDSLGDPEQRDGDKHVRTQAKCDCCP